MTAALPPEAAGKRGPMTDNVSPTKFLRWLRTAETLNSFAGAKVTGKPASTVSYESE